MKLVCIILRYFLIVLVVFLPIFVHNARGLFSLHTNIKILIYLSISILLFKVKCSVLRVLFCICTPEVRVYCTGVPQSFSFSHKCYMDWRLEDFCIKWWAFTFLDYSGIIFIVLDLKFPHIYYCGLCVDNIWLCSQWKQSGTEPVNY